MQQDVPPTWTGVTSAWATMLWFFPHHGNNNQGCKICMVTRKSSIKSLTSSFPGWILCVCVHACVRACVCVRACMCACMCCQCMCANSRVLIKINVCIHIQDLFNWRIPRFCLTVAINTGNFLRTLINTSGTLSQRLHAELCSYNVQTIVFKVVGR